MKQRLQKEQSITQTLENEKRLNDEELQRLGEDYRTLKGELDELTRAYESKQTELDGLRRQAGEDAKRLSQELTNAQKDTNILVLEVKKFEGLHRFMDMERNMIMQAQADSKGKNPGISAQEMEHAQERTMELNAKIENITDEWHEKLVEVRDQCERVLNETEVREFQTRIQKLQDELQMKTREID